jgi:hypothetical protein
MIPNWFPDSCFIIVISLHLNEAFLSERATCTCLPGYIDLLKYIFLQRIP